MIFWLINIFVVLKGIESIRIIENIGAPFLLLTGVALLIWAYFKAGGSGPIFKEPSKFGQQGFPQSFWIFFFPSLTAMVDYWGQHFLLTFLTLQDMQNHRKPKFLDRF